MFFIFRYPLSVISYQLSIIIYPLIADFLNSASFASLKMP